MIIALRDSWDAVQGRAGYSSGRVRVTIPFESAKVSKTWRVGVLVAEGAVRGLALVRSPRWASDFDRLVDIQHLYVLQPHPTLQQVADALGPHVGGKFLGALDWNGIVPPATARALEDALEQLSVGAKAAFRRLRAARPSVEVADNAAKRNLREQRDALAVALEAAGLDSRTLLDQVEVDETRSFLGALTSGKATEAAKIRHDAAVFEDWLRMPEEYVDVWRFEDPENPSRRVTILYADKLPLERITGTDLIYFREETKAWVLVQYKRMTRESKGSELGYRPDKQLDEELDRMNALAVPETPATNVSEARLSAEPFYIKLVEPDVRRPEGNRLARGLYFPVSLFKLVCRQPSVMGPKGGVRIGWHNAGRYLDNTEFLALLRGSWIGSRGMGSDVIGDAVHAALAEGRAAVVAIDQPAAEVVVGADDEDATSVDQIDLNSVFDVEESHSGGSRRAATTFSDLVATDEEG